MVFEFTFFEAVLFFIALWVVLKIAMRPDENDSTDNGEQKTKSD